MPNTTVETFQTPEGKQWRLAGTDSNGVRQFVPAHLDPTTISRLVWASEDFLRSELGDLAPVTTADAPETEAPRLGAKCSCAHARRWHFPDCRDPKGQACDCMSFATAA
ncbi:MULTISPECIES: hypothetical protein [Streptomyces]|uniref:hypothetical protein n=1 Tax=Streptomyces TaxID=1883 RepID=UPI0004CBC9F4|nr:MULTISPECIES: hypothetical protein [unclassified Streptomyces]